MKTSILNRDISVFASYAGMYPETRNLLTYLADISFKDEVLRIRATPDEDSRKALKSRLPAANISGLFSARGEKMLISHSGLISIDIDQKDNAHFKRFSDIKDILAALPFVAYCALSVSGNGYWAIIPLAYVQKHKQHFLALKELLAKKGINIDPAPSSVASLRGYSYDPDAYYNHNAAVFTLQDKKPLQVVSRLPIRPNISLTADPFKNFNAEGDVMNVLIKHGWQLLYRKGSCHYFCRPGKDAGVSADYCVARKVFYVFTSSTLFESNKAYDNVGVFCTLECNGDFKLARQKLIANGYATSTVNTI